METIGLPSRQSAINTALKIYNKLENNRAYALNEESRLALGALMLAIYGRRQKAGVHPHDNTFTAEDEMIEVIKKIAAAGCNVLQRRPGDPKPLPKPWIDPVTGQPLPPPTDLKSKTLLRKYDPDLADHYDAMAADSYAHVQSLREAEAQRQTLAAIPYTAVEHNVNVFRRSDLTEQSRFEKTAPAPVVEFLKREAQDVVIDLFGPNRNMTHEGRLFRDPRTNVVLQLAQSCHQLWRDQDRSAAETAKAEAEAALKRLEKTG
jgi:hypothetical protein